MVQAYNYMLESLPVKRDAKYPVSKKSELKKVYSDIVDLSKRSPLYKINLSKENQEYTIGVKEAALALKTKIKDMSDPEVSGFQSNTVSVSNSNVLTAKLLSEDTQGLPSDISFTVQSLASNQVNKGKDLLNVSRGLPSGQYRFTATIGENTYDLTYEQESRTENQNAMKSFADFLNKSLPGITASVESGLNKDYSRLTVATDMSGRFGDRRFTFEDSDAYIGGVVDYFGMNRMEKAPDYARFVLNEVDKKTATNAFTLEGKLQITLHKSSEDPVQLKIVPDSDKILSAVDNVLTSYNSLVKLAKDRTLDTKEHYKATKLLGEMKGLEKLYHEELSASGLVADEDGALHVEDSLAVLAAQDGGLESLFTRENGFISKLLQKAETIAINPMEYLDKTIVTYPNSETIAFRNPYVTSMYSGLFFNSYC